LKLNVELENLKFEVKTLRSVNKHQSSKKCLIQENTKASYSFESCDKFKEEIVDLKISLAKFTLGKNNLDIILRKQRWFIWMTVALEKWYGFQGSDAILPPQGHWIEDSKKIGPEMQEKALRFSWALG